MSTRSQLTKDLNGECEMKIISFMFTYKQTHPFSMYAFASSTQARE